MLGELGNRSTVADGGLDSTELATAAVALYASALLVEGNAAGRGGLAININLDLVGLKGHGADELGGSLLGKGEGTGRLDVILSAKGEIVSFGNVKGHLDGLSSGDALEGIFSQILSRDALANTVKGNGVLYRLR